MKLNIQNQNNIDFPCFIDVYHWIYITLITAKKNTFCELTINVVDKEYSKNMTKIFLKKDKVSDILAFPYTQKHIQDIIYIGDIMICPSIIIQNKEITITEAIIHSILHIVGFSHDNNKDYYNMNKIEKMVAKKLNCIS